MQLTFGVCHVHSMSQSTNDVYPTACRLAILFSDDPLIESVRNLMAALDDKAHEFKDVLKLGRTQLQDAGTRTLCWAQCNVNVVFFTHFFSPRQIIHYIQSP